MTLQASIAKLGREIDRIPLRSDERAALLESVQLVIADINAEIKAAEMRHKELGEKLGKAEIAADEAQKKHEEELSKLGDTWKHLHDEHVSAAEARARLAETDKVALGHELKAAAHRIGDLEARIKTLTQTPPELLQKGGE